jgi:hypothetical protein
MKCLLKYSSLMTVITLMLSSCKKEEIKVYQDDAGVYFTTPTYSYSFTENIGATTKLIYLPVKLSGNVKDYDRTFKIEAVNDSVTTATSDLYEIQQGILPKNSFEGKVAVLLKRNTTVDTSIVNLKVKLVGSDNLDPLLAPNVVISWTGKIIQPVNWSSLRFYFGTPFSTGWYTFMLEAAGVTFFPYTTNATLKASDPAFWWWGTGQIYAYGTKVRDALNKYNLAHPGNELKHNDGPNAGQLVTMPAF